MDLRDKIRVEKIQSTAKRKNLFSEKCNLNDPNKLFVLEETQAIQRNMMRTRDINRKAYALEESKYKRA